MGPAVWCFVAGFGLSHEVAQIQADVIAHRFVWWRYLVAFGLSVMAVAWSDVAHRRLTYWKNRALGSDIARAVVGRMRAGRP